MTTEQLPMLDRIRYLEFKVKSLERQLQDRFNIEPYRECDVEGVPIE